MKVAEAISLDTTAFPYSIKPINSNTRIFKEAKYNKKIGNGQSIIRKGKWKGLHVYTLTLIERETCPKSCHHYNDCYGNSMMYAHRFKPGKDLELKIEEELKLLDKKHPNGFVIRLHVLGDFYSVEYVKLWQHLLIQYPNLRIWGYTARYDCKIGLEIRLTRMRFPERFWVRFSKSMNYNPSDKDMIFAGKEGDDFQGITCPEQLSKTDSCLTCGLCWSINKSIKFLTH